MKKISVDLFRAAPYMLMFILSKDALFHCYAECCYAECCYVECGYAECRYAECRYAESRG